MTIYNREDPRTALPQLEKRVKQLEEENQSLKKKVDSFPMFDSGLTALPWTVSANTYADLNVSFTKAFPSAPKVIAGMHSTSTGSGSGRVSISAIGITETGFTIRIFNGDSSARQPYVSWIAILE